MKSSRLYFNIYTTYSYIFYRYLYWADYGQHPKIVRANLDGSNMVPIVTENIKLPSDMSIDIDTGDIYWTDLLRDTLEVKKLKKESINNRD